MPEQTFDPVQPFETDKDQYQLLFDNNPHPMWVNQLDSLRFIAVNNAAIRQYGFSREEFLGMLLQDLLLPEDISHWTGHLLHSHQIKSRLAPISGTWKHKRKDNSVMTVEITSQRLVFQGVDSVLILANDISDRIKAQKALSESEQRFQVMADTAPVMIWMAGLDMLCDFFNKPWLEFRGRSMEQEKGNGWAEGVHPDDFQFCLDTYINAFQKQESFRMEYRLMRFDGEYRWIMDTGVPRYTSEKEFLGYIGSCVDISEKKLAEQEVHRLNDDLEKIVLERTFQLENANKELEAFNYSVSHDLRSPIRSIDGFCRALKDEYGGILDVTATNYLERISNSCNNMKNIIDNLFTLSNVQKLQIVAASVDLSAIVERIVTELIQSHPGRKVEFVIKPGITVNGDPRLLEIALVNLMNNAWKFTANADNPRIEFGCILQDSVPVYFVRDNGAGFDMQYTRKLFSPFQRLHDVCEYPGTGIGLTIVQRVICRHGGRVWAEGQLGKGAIFYFCLPYKD